MTDDSDRHAAKMAKKKAARDKIMATKTDEKGLIIVHTGKGKGKSSAAFGMIFRCIAHDMKCAVVQFIKGGMSTGERDMILSKFSDTCSFHTMGEGFTWETQDRDRDIEMAQAAWEKAKQLIRDETNKMVLLDEINIALRYDYLDINEVVQFLAEEKPHMQQGAGPRGGSVSIWRPAVCNRSSRGASASRRALRRQGSASRSGPHRDPSSRITGRPVRGPASPPEAGSRRNRMRLRLDTNESRGLGLHVLETHPPYQTAHSWPALSMNRSSRALPSL